MVNYAPPTPMLHYYLVKATIILVVVIVLNIALNVSFVLPIPSPRRMPVWFLAFLGFIEMYGWTVIVATVVAAIWQIADKH